MYDEIDEALKPLIDGGKIFVITIAFLGSFIQFFLNKNIAFGIFMFIIGILDIHMYYGKKSKKFKYPKGYKLKIGEPDLERV